MGNFVSARQKKEQAGNKPQVVDCSAGNVITASTMLSRNKALKHACFITRTFISCHMSALVARSAQMLASAVSMRASTFPAPSQASTATRRLAFAFLTVLLLAYPVPLLLHFKRVFTVIVANYLYANYLSITPILCTVSLFVTYQLYLCCLKYLHCQVTTDVILTDEVILYSCICKLSLVNSRAGTRIASPDLARQSGHRIQCSARLRAVCVLYTATVACRMCSVLC
jgi:hypothetical protein